MKQLFIEVLTQFHQLKVGDKAYSLNLIIPVTPDYHLNFAWTLIKIGRTITPKSISALKSISEKLEYFGRPDRRSCWA